MSLNSQTLEICNLSVGYYHDTHIHLIVADLSLTIERGKILALVGASGSGKSMTCSAVLDVLPPGVKTVNGTIHLDGKQVPPKELRGRSVASIMQNPRSAFNPVRTMRQHIAETLSALGRNSHNEMVEINDTLLAVELDEPERILDLYPFEMSGGMLQRMMIAIALLSKSQFLFADEPTTDLDLIVQIKILELLEKLAHERGLGILLITHDMGVVAKVADEVAVIDTGILVEQEPVEKIFQTPKDPITRMLVSAHLSLYGMELAV
ncbi:nickel import ATP-binding protein NikD [Paenochrobactrum pullorum]|uniref:nickel import ATP-binding protein NikD n=1 Tax=Paenochrobactrum pullorum TaxID=1324351 RepID=UPI0035BC9117